MGAKRACPSFMNVLLSGNSERLPFARAELRQLAPHSHRLPHIRTFVNFGSRPDLIAQRFDLTFRSEAKRFNPRIIALRYALLATLVVPSEKASMLENFCVQSTLTATGVDEAMFLHFREDRDVTLHAGAERASNPLIKRSVPGWDPANDRNGDGAVDDDEFARLVSPRAHARKRSEARVPIYYWGPPADDFGHFGADLCLAASRDGRRVFLADQAGRIYLHEPTR